MASVFRMMRLKKLQIAAILLICSNPLRSFAATNSLPNFDKRLEPATAIQPAAVNTAKGNAVSLIRSRVQDVRIDTDEILGSPKFVASTREFLTGTNGGGGAVSPATAAAFPANDPHRGVKTFLTEHRALFGFGPEALAAAKVNRDYVSAPGNFRTVVWQQHVDDIPVFDGIFKAHLTKNGELINVGSQFVPDLPSALNKIANRAAMQTNPPISAHRAIVLAAANMGDVLTTNLISAQDAAQGNDKFQHFRGFPILNNTSARLTWLPLDASTIRLCWDINLESRARGELYRVIVDATTGEVWVRQCLTENLSSIQMNVWTGESPAPLSPALNAVSSYQPPVVPRTVVTLSALDATASRLGWINDGDNTTAGNNVDAHLDWDNDNLPDPNSRATGSPFRVFNFPIDLATQQPRDYSNAVVVSLFYWNNWAHDKFYELGFTEAAGNFQNERFGLGGYPGTAVQADGQDSYTSTNFNNANFSTPADGSPPRMQMYIFTGPSLNRDGDLDAGVMVHEYTHGVSSRLVGGGVGISALQTRGMGEGWSDFCALSLLSNPANDPTANYTVGSYVEYQDSGLTNNYYFGFRRYPYSVNTGINPLTFKDIDTNQISAHPGVPFNPTVSSNPANANEAHNMGEVWCNTLWEARARLIARLGSAAGNAQMLQLVIDGMKLTSVNPDFLEARNAIMQADLVDAGGADLDDLWIAFAKRGMGFNAGSPGSSTTTGVIQAFDLPPTSNYPFIAITGPTEESFHNSSPTVTGIADSNVVEVWIYLQRMSDNYYYNPTNGTWVVPPVPIIASGVANWSVTLPALADGLYLIGARADDGVNLAPRVYRYFSMDTTTPTLSISNPAEGAAFASPPTMTGGTMDNYYVNDVRVVLERGVDGAWYNFASNTWGTSVFDFARNVKQATVVRTNWTAMLPPLADGNYDVQVQVADHAGNATSWNVRHFSMDTSSPTVTFSPFTNTQTIFDFSQVGGQISEAGTVTFRINEYNTGGTADRYWDGENWITNGNSPSVQLAAQVTGNSWTPTAALPTRGQTRYGAYFLRAVGTDLAGNAATNEILVFRSAADTTPPVVTLNTIHGGDVFTNPSLPSLFGSALDNESGIASVNVYLNWFTGGNILYWNGSIWSSNPAVLPATYNAQTVAWQLNATLPSGANLANGSYQVQVAAQNNESPVGSKLLSVAFTVDYHPVYVFNYGSRFTVTPNMNWDSPDNWDVGRVPYPEARVVINGYSPVIPSALGVVPIYELDMSGGTLTMSGMNIQKLNLSGGEIHGGALTLTNNGTNVWSGGTFDGICTISAGATLNLSGSATKTLGPGAVIDNRGTINWAGPGVIYNYAYNPADRATITNQTGAVFNLTADGQVFTHSYTESLFYNLPGAQLRKSSGTNATTFNNFTLLNSGEVRVDSGAILFDGYCTLDTGTTLTGTGAVRLLGTADIKALVPGTANLRLEAGTLTASGPAAYGGSAGMDWIGGTLAGTLEIASGSSLRISEAATKTLAGGAKLNNHGLITWAGPGVIYNYSYDPADRATINNFNGGVFSMITDGQVFAHSYSYSWFNNQAGAKFTKDTGAGTTLINNFIFNNVGEISAVTGTLEFNDVLNLGGGTFTGPAQFLISSGLTTLSNLTAIDGSAVTMTDGTLFGDAPSSGTLGSTNGGSFNWAGGALGGTVGIAPGAAFKISGAAQKTMNGGTILNNRGNVTWSGSGAIYNYAYNPADRATINNLSAASFTVISNAVFSYSYNASAFNNASNATFVKVGGGGVTTCGWVFNNSGAAGCTSGTLALAGGGNSSGSFSASGNALLRFTDGTHSLTNGTRFTGDGHVQIDGATLLLGGTLTMGLPAQPLALDLLTGTLAGNGTEAGNFICTWSGGVIGGNLTNATGGAIVVTNTGNKTLGGGAVLNNQGTITWFGPGTIYNYAYYAGDTATINNQSNGLFAVAADGQVFNNDYNPSTLNNLPGARFVKSAGTNATSINHILFDSSGEIGADSGSLLFDYQLALEPNARVTGVGTVRLAGNTTLSGNLNGTGNLRLEAGQLTGITNATYFGGGGFDWTGGAVGGVLTLAPTSGLNISGPARKDLAAGAILNNQGTITWTGPGTIYNYAYYAGDKATINNQSGAKFIVASDGQVFAHDYTPSTFNNFSGAQFTKSAGTNSVINHFVFNSSGEVRVDTGSLLFNDRATFGPGGSLTGSGLVRWGGDIGLAGTVTGVANVQLEAGTLTGVSNATYSGAGPLNWTGGALAGTTTVASGSILNLTGGGKILAGGAVLNNQGTINWSGPGTLYNYSYNLGDRATLNNLAGGVFNLVTDGPVFSYDYNPSFLTNAAGAKIRKTGGTGSTSLNYTFANSGVIEVRAGTVTFDGNYASAAPSSELDLVLGGVTPGTEFTRLATGGNLPLDGVLKVTLTNSFTPTNGQSFVLANYGSSTGQFATTQLPTLPAKSKWQLVYNPGSLVLQVVPSTVFLSSSLTNGAFQFSFAGQTGSSCLIEVSTNLLNWTPLLTNTPFNGTLNYVDPQTVQFRTRFYRATVFP